MNVIVGIDLGTTRSSVAILEGLMPSLIPINGLTQVPSVVACANNGKGEILVGEAARRQALINPQHTIVAIKKLMGKRFKDIEPILDFFPYKILAGENDVPNVFMGGKAYSPQEISAIILRHLKDGAEAYLGQPVENCVLTIPANFSSTEMEATREACEMAGLKLLRILREPTAACFAFGAIQKAQGAESMIAVFDLGGSSTDVSLVEMGDGVFEVKATTGDNFLGGVDFDYAIANALIAKLKSEQGIDLHGDPIVWHRMMDAAEKAKIELSFSEETMVHLPFVSINGQIRDLQIAYTRTELEFVCQPLFERCLFLCKNIKTRLNYDQPIDELVLVGSATRMPKLRHLLRDLFEKQPVPSVNPEEIVALGAAVQCSILSGQSSGGIMLLDTTAHAFGIIAYKNCVSVSDDSAVKQYSLENGQYVEVVEAYTTLPFCKMVTLTPKQAQIDFSVFEKIDGNPKMLRRTTLDLHDYAPENPGCLTLAFNMDANGRLSVEIVYEQEAIAYKQMLAVGESAIPFTPIHTDHISIGKKRMKYGLPIRAVTGLSRAVLDHVRQNETFGTLLEAQKKQLDAFRSQMQADQLFRMERLLDSLSFWINCGEKAKIAEIQHDMQQQWQVIAQQKFLGIEPDLSIRVDEAGYRQELYAEAKNHMLALLDTPEGLLQTLEKLAANFGQTELILLLSRYRQSMKDYHQGQLTKAEYDVEVNRMRKSMLFHFEESGKQPDYDWRYFQRMQWLLQTLTITPATN